MLVRLGPAINSGRGLFLYRAAGQRQDQHRRADHRVPSARTIWIPRAIGIDGEIMRLFDPGMHEEVPLSPNQGLIDQAQDRPALGPHPPADDRRRRRAHDGPARSHHQHLDQHQRSPAANEEQLRHAGDRRLRPPEDDHRPVAQPLDRAAGKTLRLPQHGQRQEDPSAVRPVDRVLHQPGAAGTWSTMRSCGGFRTRSKSPTPAKTAFRELLKIMAPEGRRRLRRRRGRLPDRKALPVDQSPVPLLPAARPDPADPQLLPLRSQTGQDDAGEFRLRRGRTTSP